MKIYNRREVEEHTSKYFDGDNLATKVWIDKYSMKDSKDNIYELTPEDMHRRLAKEFARIENNYPNPMSEDLIFHLLDRFKYIVPQGSPMFGIGNDFINTSLSNCFVIGSNDDSDSYGSIMRTDEEQVQLMKRRGGVGHDISHLRPSGAVANNSVLKGMAGSTLYMERFSNSTREVSQGDRRGALMLSISINHPDAELFIDKKTEQGKVTGANISVKVTDEFMDAVRNNKDFLQTFPVNFKSSLKDYKGLEYDKVYDLDNGIYIKRIDAKKLWKKIIRNAWNSAEPGILFWDNIIKESPADSYDYLGYKTESTNPCGEVPLCQYDSCRLLAMNLYSYVENPFTKEAKFDFDLFKEHVDYAQRLMDDLVDLEIEKVDKILNKIESDPEPDYVKKVEYELWNKIKEKAVEARRTGLGITGEGDMIAALGMRYGTEKASDFSEKVHEIMAVESYKSSIKLAEERGTFPIWNYKAEKDNPFIDRIIDSEYFDVNYFTKYKKSGRRNIANLTVAPTGSVSIMTQTTSGIEPVFLPVYKRRRKINDRSKATFVDELGDLWEEYRVFHHKFVDWFRINYWEKVEDRLGVDSPEEWLKECSDEILDRYIRESPYHKATSSDVDYIGKVELQGRVQKWIDHSISVTVNMPEDVTEETVANVYKTAYDVGCKGVTVYREGSRSGVLISDSKKGKNEDNEIIYNDAPKRPQTVECDIYNISRGKEPYTLVVGLLKGKPIEIFALDKLSNSEFSDKIKKGWLKKTKSQTYELTGFYNDKKYVIENIVEYMSLDEQKNTRKFSQMLRHGIHPKYIREQIQEYATITSFDRVIDKALSHYMNGERLKGEQQCPECGSTDLKPETGCITCNNCGWSKCS